MRKFCVPLEKISEKDHRIVGNKAVNLNRLIKAGFAVPKGFVITSTTFSIFLKENVEEELRKKICKICSFDLKEEKLIKSAQKEIQDGKISGSIRKEIIKNFLTLHTDLVAVRSSAISEDSQKTSFAGQFETFLNTRENVLIDNIKRCWASCLDLRVISYRVHTKLVREAFEMAVIIQKMIVGAFSGVLFTMHPLAKDEKEIVIELVQGVGDVAVSGEVSPAHLVLNKKSLTIEQSIPNRQKLPDLSLVRKLAEDALEIESLFGRPQDIEWTIENDKIYFLQSRPITSI